MGKRSPEGQGELKLEGEIIMGALCFNEIGSDNQDLVVGGEGRFYNEKGDAFEWDQERHGYILKKEATPPDLKAMIERLKNDPQNKYIKDNENAMRAKAEIALGAMKSGTSYETTPYPPLDN